MDELFADADDPMGALRWTLAELRRKTGLVNAFRGNPVSLPPGMDVVADVANLPQAVQDGELPEGYFLEGIEVRGSPGFESWLLVERQRVDSEVLSALRQAALRALSGRDFPRAVELSRAMVERAPLEEGPHVLLVKALASSGDTAAALRQAAASEAMLTAELGTKPTPAIRAAVRPAIAGPIPGVSARASAETLCEAGLAALSAGAADAGIECLRGASAAAELSGDKELQSRCLTELGAALVHSIRGYDDEGSIILAAAVDLAAAAGAESVSAKALSELAYVDILAGRRTSAAGYLETARGLTTGDASLSAAIAGFEAMNLSDWGRLEPAADRFGDAVELSRKAGAARREAWNLGVGARSLFILGRADEAAEWARQSCEIARTERWAAFRPWPEGWLAHARLAAGERPAVVREEAEATFALARQLQDPCWEGLAAKTIGLTHLLEGNAETALEWMQNAGTLCGRVTDSYTWMQVEILLAEARAALDYGDVARADAVARQAVAGAARGSMNDLLDRALGLLASLPSTSG
ncbi:AfsR/SARP family transcriptional regulator [Pseudarthrobacter sp. NS4]|uniref:AfsR/SARP family transcriptional regulator n=1 Tax=Pseudarthrobacter sp. NS4 TaxID=2973976 RepID=UPI0021639F74|nr:BTAD domain-containing putative transcriptional regulator [Pseudarthrobacter sp. NS4]